MIIVQLTGVRNCIAACSVMYERELAVLLCRCDIFILACEERLLNPFALVLFTKKREGGEREGVRVRETEKERVCLFVGCLTSQQHASVSQGRIYSDKFMCCHTEIEVTNQTLYLTVY